MEYSKRTLENEEVKAMQILKKSNFKIKNSRWKTLLEHFLVAEFRILENIRYWNGCYIFVILAIVILYSSLILLVPQHNAIETPEYWYELIFLQMSAMTLCMIAVLVQKCWICLRIRFLVSLGTILRLFFALAWDSTYHIV